MNENLDFYQGSKENYNPQEMRGGVYFCKDTKEIMLNGDEYGRDSNWALLDSVENSILTQNTEPVLSSDNIPLVPKSDTYQASGVQISELPEQLNLQDDDYFVIQGINGTQKVSSDTIKADIKNDINIVYLPWNTDIKTTRLQIPFESRKKGLTIRYLIQNTELVEETYKESNVYDASWQSDSNWQYNKFKGWTNDLNINPVDNRSGVYYLTTITGTFTNVKNRGTDIIKKYSNIEKLTCISETSGWHLVEYDMITSTRGSDLNWGRIVQGVININRTSTNDQEYYTIKVGPETYYQGINCAISNEADSLRLSQKEYTVERSNNFIWITINPRTKDLEFFYSTRYETTGVEIPSFDGRNYYIVLGILGFYYGRGGYFPFSEHHIKTNLVYETDFFNIGNNATGIQLDCYSFNRVQYNFDDTHTNNNSPFGGECLLDLEDTGQDNIWYALGILPEDEPDEQQDNTRTFKFSNIDLSVTTTKDTTAFIIYKWNGVWAAKEVELSQFLNYSVDKYYLCQGWYFLVNPEGWCRDIESNSSRNIGGISYTTDYRANIVCLRNDARKWEIRLGHCKGINFYGVFTSDFYNRRNINIENCSFSLPSWYTANTNTYFINTNFYDRDYTNVQIKNCTFNMSKLYICIYVDLGDNIEITGCEFNIPQIGSVIRVNNFKTSCLIRGNKVYYGTTGIFFGSQRTRPISNAIVENNIVMYQNEESIAFDGFGNNIGLIPVIGNGNIESVRNDEEGRLVIVPKLYKATSSLDGTPVYINISDINNWTDYYFTFNRNTNIDGTICKIYSYNAEEGSLTLDIYQDASTINTTSKTPDLGNYLSDDSVVGVQSGFFDCVVRNNIIKSDRQDYCTALSIFLNCFNFLVENNKVYLMNNGISLSGGRSLTIHEVLSWGNKVINNTFMNCNEININSLYGQLPQYNNVFQGNILKNVKKIIANAQKNFVYKDNVLDNVQESDIKYCESYVPDENNLKTFQMGTIYNKFINDSSTGELLQIDPYIVISKNSTLQLKNLNDLWD